MSIFMWDKDQKRRVDLSRVVSFHHRGKKWEETIAHFEDGSQSVFSGDASEISGRIAMARCPMVPAQSGFRLLELWTDELDYGVNETPVIAWAIFSVGEPVPIGALGPPEGQFCVLLPDGQAASIFGLYRSRDDWLKAVLGPNEHGRKFVSG